MSIFDDVLGKVSAMLGGVLGSFPTAQASAVPTVLDWSPRPSTFGGDFGASGSNAASSFTGLYRAGSGNLAHSQAYATDAAAAEKAARAPGPGSSGAVPYATGQLDNSSPEAFRRSAYQMALPAAQAFDLPPTIMAAIAANETGHGNPAYTHGNNYFGIKGAHPQTGATTGPLGTWEVTNGQQQNIQDSFRAYASPGESFQDFGQFLNDNPRYAPALQTWRDTRDPAQFIRAVQAAGYATDPHWADKILTLASQVPTDQPQAAVPHNYVVPTNAPSFQARQQLPAGSLLMGGQPLYVLTGYHDPMNDGHVTQHRGVDLRAADGTSASTYGQPVVSPVSGQVIYNGVEGYGGHGVIIQGDDGLYHHFYHLQPEAVGPGRISRGDRIGAVGWADQGTNDSHLHYEVANSGATTRQEVDPWAYILGQAGY